MNVKIKMGVKITKTPIYRIAEGALAINIIIFAVKSNYDIAILFSVLWVVLVLYFIAEILLKGGAK